MAVGKYETRRGEKIRLGTHVTIHIHRNGDQTNSDNYRAIYLSNKIVIEEKLRKSTENKLENDQTAFRPNRETTGNIFI